MQFRAKAQKERVSEGGKSGGTKSIKNPPRKLWFQRATMAATLCLESPIRGLWTFFESHLQSKDRDIPLLPLTTSLRSFLENDTACGSLSSPRRSGNEYNMMESVPRHNVFWRRFVKALSPPSSLCPLSSVVAFLLSFVYPEYLQLRGRRLGGGKGPDATTTRRTSRKRPKFRRCLRGGRTMTEAEREPVRSCWPCFAGQVRVSQEAEMRRMTGTR